MSFSNLDFQVSNNKTVESSNEKLRVVCFSELLTNVCVGGLEGGVRVGGIELILNGRYDAWKDNFEKTHRHSETIQLGAQKES